MNQQKILLLVMAMIVIAVAYYFFASNPQENTEEVVSVQNANDTEANTPSADSGDAGKIDIANALAGLSDSDISFVHVVPGEYSEVYYVERGGRPGETIYRTLEGPGVLEGNDQIVAFDENGEARFTWKINRYGTYGVYHDVYDPYAKEDIPRELKQVIVK